MDMLMRFRIVFFLGYFILASGRDLRIERVSEKFQHIDLGAPNVNVSCRVLGDDYHIARTPVLFYKQDDAGNDLEILQTLTIKPPFKRSGRYDVTLTEDDRLYTLNIRNVRLADNGTYKCVVGTDEVKPVRSSIIVQSDIESLVLETNSTRYPDYAYGGDDLIRLHHGQAYRVSCEVKGGNPRPELSMLLDETDITSHYHINIVEVKSETDEGLTETQYQISAENNNYLPAKTEDGSTLTCKASVPETSFKTTSRVRIEVIYPPTIICQERVIAKLGHEDLQVICHIEANPPIQLNQITWSWQGDNGTVYYDLGANDTQYMTSAEVLENGSTEARLHINQVDETDFRTYTLSAMNEVATATRNISVIKQGKPIVRPPKKDQVISNEDGNPTGNAGVLSFNRALLIGAFCWICLKRLNI